ncbi:hypothetical protein PC9H_005061 [Pleurotus ostreatus]|uniref:Nucleoporin Nup120/160-domain-containing protein n=1 Tax=Pleurotus ostreatus TaxID=5322 RepID=A0A8H7A018_PLEOS|nr:uncharacterized protein PC9H_005061 [Pleurotus ostreatus]KAF7433113.1 hypothetical protein PC9H_005061 [Pleurotus ostreatus]
MNGSVLVAAQLSSIFPSAQAATLAIHTIRQKTPLPAAPKDSDPPPEHASYASVLQNEATGTLLLRVLHGSLIVELISLSTDTLPIRFVFPSPILPHPGVFVWGANQLHLLAVTLSGSLYRVVIPLEDGVNLWKHQTDRFTYHEYLIKTFQEDAEGLVQIQGPHSVAIGLQNGELLRLESDSMGHSVSEDSWTETVFQHGSFLTSLTSFLHAQSPNTAEVVSIATHPWPTDLGHVWTLSRDRTLRLWKAKIGCVASRSLALTRESPGPSAHAPPLLETQNQQFLQVFSTGNETVYVLVFVPTVSSSTSGGSFRLFRTTSDQLHDEGIIECSPNSAHCHLQDFRVIDMNLYVLWDRQGQSMVERSVINTDTRSDRSGATPWYPATYAREPELTPAYLEELLLSPGSLTDKFFEAIMRPGRFSPLTLRTAIDQYTNACLALPGPTPLQLTTTYATLGEQIAAVVGCTVNLVRDPKTGTLQHGNYWNALKRDWEGFIARCREVERSARWPLVLGEHDRGEVVVVERERVGMLVQEDAPLSLHRAVVEGRRLGGNANDLLELLWTIWAKLDPQARLNLESWISDSIQQENAFAWADMIQDQVERASFVDDIDEGFHSWVFGRLQGIHDFTSAVRNVLDLVSDFDSNVVKREVDEEDTPLYQPRCDWLAVLTAAYATITIQARHEFCLALISLLFLLADDLTQWDPSLLAEIFAVFRGTAMLQHVAHQPAAETTPVKQVEDATGADEVIARMREMQVSRTRTQVPPSHSLIHRLVAQDAAANDVQVSAHRFLAGLGLSDASSTSHATKFDVLFCERLRLLKYYHVAREMLSWLPRTPGVTYVFSRLLLDIGRADDASFYLEKLAGCFGPHSGVAPEDIDSLRAVLPNAELFDSDHLFYLHAAALFHEHSFVGSEVLFTKLALSTVPHGADTSGLWLTIIKGSVDLRLYDDAYESLMACPYEKLNRDCVTQLVYRMCEDDAVEKLISFNFGSLVDEVEDALSFKARNVDPRIRPYYSKILYTWHVTRGDYRSAASSMYLRARKLYDLMSDPGLFSTFALDQLEAYTVAINALSLIEEESAWISLPIQTEYPTERRKLTKHIPNDKFTTGTYDVEIIDIKDMQYDYALLSAQLDAVQKDPSLLSSGEFLLPPSAIVIRLAQSNSFNTALSAGRSLDVDLTDVFSYLTSQCIRLERRPESILQEDTTDWLLTDQVSTWTGTPADRGWRHLRQSLDRHDGIDTDFKYSKTVLDTILSFEKASTAPPWLIRSLEENCHEHLIRTYLRYESIGDAVASTLSLIHKADAQLGRDPKRQAGSTWLSYTLIDQVLAAAESHPSTVPKISTLKTELASRVKRMQRLGASA